MVSHCLLIFNVTVIFEENEHCIFNDFPNEDLAKGCKL